MGIRSRFLKHVFWTFALDSFGVSGRVYHASNIDGFAIITAYLHP